MERGSRVLQIVLNAFCERVGAAEHAPRDPIRLLERRHGLAEIVERGVGVLIVMPLTSIESHATPYLLLEDTMIIISCP